MAKKPPESTPSAMTGSKTRMLQSKSAVPTLGKDAQSLIGSQLRSMHESLVEQPLPPRLLELLGKLEAATNSDLDDASATGRLTPKREP